MEIGEYQARVARFSPYYGIPGARRDETNWAVLGLCETFLLGVEDALEVGRWKVTPTLENAYGDYLRYVALYATANGVDLGSVQFRAVADRCNRPVYQKRMRQHLGKVAMTTKARWHGFIVLPPDGLRRQCYDLRDYAYGLALRLRINVPEVLQHNLEKFEKVTKEADRAKAE